MSKPTRRTKRIYAHEIYPHPDEDEVRDLAEEVPYLYAQAIAWNVWETGWSDADKHLVGQRFHTLILARERALLADALFQGLVGDAAWRWAQEHHDESGELIYDRAVHYGVDVDRIKPYPCGDEPGEHYCGEGQPDGSRVSVNGREDECPHCSEPQ